MIFKNLNYLFFNSIYYFISYLRLHDAFKFARTTDEKYGADSSLYTLPGPKNPCRYLAVVIAR